MLDRSTCEILARAYPEIAAHRFEEGDYFYHQDDDRPRPPGPILNHRGFAAPGDTWCPRLDQLLAIARSVRAVPVGPTADDLDRLLDLREGVPSVDGEDAGWEFGIWCAQGDCWDWDPRPGQGASPEGAVAAWLTARVRAGA